MDGAAGVKALGAAAQYHRVARLHAQTGGFGHLQKGHGVIFADFDNDGDTDVFEQMGAALELLGANPFRVNSHQRVARLLKDMNEDVAAIVAEATENYTEPGGDVSEVGWLLALLLAIWAGVIGR